MKKYATTFLAIVATLNLCTAQPKLLPRPSGEFFVGMDYLCFTDTTRKEIFDSHAIKFREITVKTWYPADDEPVSGAPYFYHAEKIVDYFSFPEIYAELRTNSSRYTPLSNKEKTYPVVVFNHGWGEHFAQNTILMEELASKGYVVFSIAHHYECKFSFYPDGKFIPMDMNNNRFKEIMHEQQNPGAMDLIIKMVGLNEIDEQRQILIDQSNALPTLLNESPVYWANDIAFFLDQLEKINVNSRLFRGKLDLKRIGIMGMSMGGMATNEICMSDTRVKAGINMDGGLTGTQLNREIQCPFMFLNGRRYVGYGALFTQHIIRDGYSLSVRNADHYNFTDYSIYKLQGLSFLMGKIEGNRIIEIMNNLVVMFFDKYLKQKQNINILNHARVFPEIEIWTNM